MIWVEGTRRWARCDSLRCDDRGPAVFSILEDQLALYRRLDANAEVMESVR